MNVLFISPELKFNTDTPPMPLGIMAIGTYLKQRGHNVKIFNRSTNTEPLIKIYNEFNPDVVGITIISTRMVKDAIKVSKFFKSHGVPVVWGGIFPSTLPQIILKEDYVDYVSIGEGEKTWDEFLAALENKTDLTKIKGLAFKDNGKITVNPDREFLEPHEIPAIDYSLVDINEYTNNYGEKIGTNMIWLYSAKGCPHQCAFCYNKAFNKCKYRRRPIDSYMEEIKYLLENTKVNSIFFADEIWCYSKKDLRERCQKMKEYNLNFTWGCFMNVGVLDYEDYQYMYECGCRLIYFGLESGSQDILDKMKKPIKANLSVSDIKACSDAGIHPFISFIIGFPNETKEDLKKTADMLKEVSFYGKLFCYFYIPYVGSELFDSLVKNKKISEIKNIKDINLRFPFNTIVKNSKRNLSNVPTKDLNLIYSYSLLWSFFNNADLRACKNLFSATYKGVTDFIKHNRDSEYKGVSRLSFLYGCVYTYVAALFRVFFYRKTAKKYSLKLR